LKIPKKRPFFVWKLTLGATLNSRYDPKKVLGKDPLLDVLSP